MNRFIAGAVGLFASLGLVTPVRCATAEALYLQCNLYTITTSEPRCCFGPIRSVKPGGTKTFRIDPPADARDLDTGDPLSIQEFTNDIIHLHGENSDGSNDYKIDRISGSIQVKLFNSRANLTDEWDGQCKIVETVAIPSVILPSKPSVTRPRESSIIPPREPLPLPDLPAGRARIRAVISELRSCLSAVRSKPAYSTLLPHLRDYTFDSRYTMTQLEDDRTPSPDEAELLQAYIDESAHCKDTWLAGVDQILPESASIRRRLVADTQAILLQLVRRRLTWGAAAQREQQLLESDDGKNFPKSMLW
jgi:hypothetical protein